MLIASYVRNSRYKLTIICYGKKSVTKSVLKRLQ
nr:MAG TPA: hypothetical protein [Bacteriophage sp.]